MDDDNDDGSSQQFLASDAHGTQMAKIIGSIDPCCDLYIARVASRRSGITYESVAKVSYLPPLRLGALFLCRWLY